jgi:hypothetical protein
MIRWKERDTDACPRCGLPEDAPHVWVCSGEGATDVWSQSISTPEEWMISVDTDPNVEETIIWNLNRWRDPNNTGHLPIVIDDIIEQQDGIGWRHFFEGKISLAWEETQQKYYTLLKSRHTGKRWTISSGMGFVEAQKWQICINTAVLSPLRKSQASIKKFTTYTLTTDGVYSNTTDI